MIAGFSAILASVPTVNQPGEHGPLSLDEIDQAAAYVRRLGEEVKADRDAGRPAEGTEPSP